MLSTALLRSNNGVVALAGTLDAATPASSAPIAPVTRGTHHQRLRASPIEKPQGLPPPFTAETLPRNVPMDPEPPRRKGRLNGNLRSARLDCRTPGRLGAILRGRAVPEFDSPLGQQYPQAVSMPLSRGCLGREDGAAHNNTSTRRGGQDGLHPSPRLPSRQRSSRDALPAVAGTGAATAATPARCTLVGLAARRPVLGMVNAFQA